jgi:hypothetical protein
MAGTYAQPHAATPPTFHPLTLVTSPLFLHFDPPPSSPPSPEIFPSIFPQRPSSRRSTAQQVSGRARSGPGAPIRRHRPRPAARPPAPPPTAVAPRAQPDVSFGSSTCSRRPPPVLLASSSRFHRGDSPFTSCLRRRPSCRLGCL